MNGGGSSTVTFDLNGNLTSDGVNSYAWDAENRLVRITYPGTSNFSDFNVDGLSRNVKIVETTSGSVTSTKQFVWNDSIKDEERDASGSSAKQFFGLGQVNSTTNYFYSKDHLGSIREMTDNGGIKQAQYAFSPFGQVLKLTGSQHSDFQFAAYYKDMRSGLNHALRRFYSSESGSWINRDPVAESGGVNLFSYVSNEPIRYSDPLGLARNQSVPCTPDMNCIEMAENMRELARELLKRRTQLRSNRRNLPQTGKNSVAGHQQQFLQIQCMLNNCIAMYYGKGCFGPLSGLITEMASEPLPQQRPQAQPPDSISPFDIAPFILPRNWRFIRIPRVPFPIPIPSG